jgi:hypothetical protein
VKVEVELREQAAKAEAEAKARALLASASKPETSNPRPKSKPRKPAAATAVKRARPGRWLVEIGDGCYVYFDQIIAFYLRKGVIRVQTMGSEQLYGASLDGIYGLDSIEEPMKEEQWFDFYDKHVDKLLRVEEDVWLNPQHIIKFKCNLDVKSDAKMARPQDQGPCIVITTAGRTQIDGQVEMDWNNALTHQFHGGDSPEWVVTGSYIDAVLDFINAGLPSSAAPLKKQKREPEKK